MTTRLREPATKRLTKRLVISFAILTSKRSDTVEIESIKYANELGMRGILISEIRSLAMTRPAKEILFICFGPLSEPDHEDRDI